MKWNNCILRLLFRYDAFSVLGASLVNHTQLCLNFQTSALDFALSTEATVKDMRLNCDGGAGSCYSRTKDCVSLSLHTNSILHTAPLWLQSEGIPALSWESVRGGREELFHSKSPFVWGPLIGPLFENQGAKEGLEIYFSPSIKQNEQYVLRERKSPRLLVHLKKSWSFYTRTHSHRGCGNFLVSPSAGDIGARVRGACIYKA